MTDINQLSKWNRDISRAIAALGTEQFFPTLVEAVNGQVKIDYPQIWLYHKDLPPRILYHGIPKHAMAAQVDRYLEGPYREDPFYQTSMQQPRSKIYRLSRVTMGRLQGSDYYCSYYADTGTCDEAVYLAKLQAGNVINLSMMRLAERGPFSDQEYESLYLLAEPVSELLKSHTEHSDFAATNLIQPGIDHQIDLAFRTFGASLLSPREKDVLELMLRGTPGHCRRNCASASQEYLSQAGCQLPDRSFFAVSQLHVLHGGSRRQGSTKYLYVAPLNIGCPM
jgi:hypothetical protein